MKSGNWLAAAACVAALGLAACGGGGSGGDAGSNSTPGGVKAVYSPAVLTKTDSTVGSGDLAVLGATVYVNYSVYLYDMTKSDFRGTRVDATVAGTPDMFALQQGAISDAWLQGIEGMKVGGKRTLLIPAGMASGSAGKGQVPSGSGLVVDVELVKVGERVWSPATLVKTDTTVGAGKEAGTGKAVEVYYSIYLYDATKADFRGAKVDGTSAGSPIAFLLQEGALIEGWVLGVPGMKEGGKRTLLIPASQAYGANGHGKVPGSSGLVADIELVKAQAAVESPATLVKTDITVGTGAQAALNKTISVNYAMYLYDSSKADFKGIKVMASLPNMPVSVTLNAQSVPEGWLQGVPGMKVGGSRTLLIPSAQAYGTSGNLSYAIAPNAGLVADIQLLSVQ